MTTIAQLFHRVRKAHNANREQKRMQQLAAYYTQAVQATEWHDRMYITYRGLPIICADDLKTSMPEAIQRMRCTLAAFTIDEEAK